MTSFPQLPKALGRGSPSNLVSQNEMAHLGPPERRTPLQIQRHRRVLQKDLPNQPFPVAAKFWIREHSRYVSTSTIDYYEQYTVSLENFFGETILRAIKIEDIRAYQDWRAINENTATAGAGRCNMETWALQAILKEANLWHKFVKHYRPLPIPREKKDGSGQSFTPEQIEKIKIAGLKKTKRHLAHHCLMLMLYTGMGFGELQMMQRAQLDIEGREMRVLGGAKNDERDRIVPLNDNALPHAKWILDRWIQLGGTRSTQYLLPSRPKSISGQWNFDVPMTSIKTAWYAILEDAKLKDVAWKRLRIYDCRVTAVTKVLKGRKVSLHTAKKLFGHVSEAMQRRYYKPELELLHEAAKELEEA